jgi:hypothetical protein
VAACDCLSPDHVQLDYYSKNEANHGGVLTRRLGDDDGWRRTGALGTIRGCSGSGIVGSEDGGKLCRSMRSRGNHDVCFE